jgi:UDPglucose--hexose-1-phosphate uridylyltransferase
MNIDYPHRRYNPLTREWVLVSPHRARRPWLGQVEKIPPENLPPYDPTCYLCPGNARVGGVRNEPYTSTYVFPNDFPALLTPEQMAEEADNRFESLEEETALPGLPPRLFRAIAEMGLARVVCFSPRHDLSLPLFSQEEVEDVVRTWTGQTREIAALDFIRYVQVFENKGAMMGASNPHPHSQIWATSQVPVELAKERAAQAGYLAETGRCLLCDTLEAERMSGERVVAENNHFTALAPFWAIWPFEVLLIAHRHSGSLPDLHPEEVSGLADIIRQVTTRYDNLFEVSFPYSMGFHQAPTDGGDDPGWHLHAHYYPPLLRSATVRKFMVGYELLGMPQRDLTPETAAARLRELSPVHYRIREGLTF